MRERPFRVPALALALALASPPGARADAAESYREGLEAVEAADWTAAARAMEQAIAVESRESDRIQLDEARYATYLPHFWLGVAHFQLGNCEAALEAWKASTTQGVIRELEEYSTLLDLRGECEERVAEEKPEPSAVVRVNTVEVVAPAPPEPPPAAAEPEPPPAASDPGPPPEPAPKPLPKEPAAPVTEPAAPKAPREPPEALLSAARAYSEGAYGAVLEALSGQELEDRELSAQAWLLRAAARYSLYLLGGEEDETLIEEARKDLAASRRLAPDLKPDPGRFSPRVMAFFEGRASPGTPPPPPR